MPSPVILPKQGNSVESCIIASWLKQPGDTVAAGDPLCEVETDKATVEVVAPVAGILLAQFAAVGEDVPVMTAIAAVGAAGEDVSALAPSASPAAAAASIPADILAVGKERVRVEAPPPSAPVMAPGSSPRARATAAQRGVAIGNVSGSGPGGLVIARDIPAAAGAPAAADYVDVPVKGIRAIIAERMQASLARSAQLTLTATAKAQALQAWRARVNPQAESLGMPSITITDLILFVVSRVLPRFPECNAHWLGDRIRRFHSVNLGLAVDTERGLMVPVVQDAQRLRLADLAREAKALAQVCQAGKARPEQLQGATFSVTNVGALGIETFTPVLNVPEVAILGVGAITLRPYPAAEKQGGIEFIPSIHLSLTIDHQALDGAPAARFLRAVVQAIESIDAMLVL